MSWLVGLIVAKWGFYLGAAALVGGNAMLLFFHQRTEINTTALNKLDNQIGRWQVCSLLIALFCAAAVVPLSSAMLAEVGLQGLWDPMMLSIVWESTIGEQSLTRIGGLALAITALIIHRLTFTSLATYFNLLSILVLAVSFTLSGHSSAIGIYAKVLVAVHIVMAFWWLGSLWPLIKSCDELNPLQLQNALHHYGKQAMVWVGLLLISGTTLLVILINATEQAINIQYLVVIAFKIILVVAMLGFAAYHKWKLVEHLEQQGSNAVIKRSIIKEGIVGLSIILLTAILTTALGIAH